MNLVIYTAITDFYDSLNDPIVNDGNQAEFVAFLTHPQPTQKWKIRPAYSEFRDPCRNARKHKTLSHRQFPKAEYSCWIDGSLTLKKGFSIRLLIDRLLTEHDIAVFAHPKRNCVYQEAKACIQARKDRPDLIRRQVRDYRNDGYPPNYGLAETRLLLRRHSDRVEQFNEAWQNEIQSYSRRDQLSFNYVAYKLGLKIKPIQDYFSMEDLFEVRRHRHET